jgi:ElaB/YqjD/DUF883 family membrane-anchored ribosome-binding protein
MDLNELCEILEDMFVDYSSLEDLDEIRDLVLKSVSEQNSSVSERRKSQVGSVRNLCTMSGTVCRQTPWRGG